MSNFGARASRLNAQGRSPVDGRMDTPAGCPRAHPQAVGCPQAPQGPTTGDGKAQAIPRALLRHRRAVNSHQGGHQPASSPVFLQSQPRNPAPSLRSVTFPKSPVTFAEMRTRVGVPCAIRTSGKAGHGCWPCTVTWAERALLRRDLGLRRGMADTETPPLPGCRAATPRLGTVDRVPLLPRRSPHLRGA